MNWGVKSLFACISVPLITFLFLLLFNFLILQDHFLLNFVFYVPLMFYKYLFYIFSYDAVGRTSLVIQVMEKSLKCVCRDGRLMHMSYEPQELRDLIYCQVDIFFRSNEWSIAFELILCCFFYLLLELFYLTINFNWKFEIFYFYCIVNISVFLF